MRFRFFEYVFFVSAFGAVALFPAAVPFLPVLRAPVTALVLALAGMALFAALALYEKNRLRRAQGTALLCAALAGCAALFMSVAEQSLPPAFAYWCVAGLVAVLTFGSILARRFFRTVQKDFRRNMAHVIATGLAANAALLLIAAACALFPPVLIGIAVAAVTLASIP